MGFSSWPTRPSARERRTIQATRSRRRSSYLLSADGLNSTIRTSQFGGEKPRYAGYTAWRAVVEPSHELLPWGVGFESWGSGARFGCAHIGGGRVYWFATRNAPEGEKDGPVGSSSGPKATLMKLFGGWHQPVAELHPRARAEPDHAEQPAAAHA